MVFVAVRFWFRGLSLDLLNGGAVHFNNSFSMWKWFLPLLPLSADDLEAVPEVRWKEGRSGARGTSIALPLHWLKTVLVPFTVSQFLVFCSLLFFVFIFVFLIV